MRTNRSRPSQRCFARPTRTRKRFTAPGLASSLIIGAVVALSGCAAMRGNTDSESSFAPDWGSALRMPPANSEISGLSETSRQIERNLGFE